MYLIYEIRGLVIKSMKIDQIPRSDYCTIDIQTFNALAPLNPLRLKSPSPFGINNDEAPTASAQLEVFDA